MHMRRLESENEGESGLALVTVIWARDSVVERQSNDEEESVELRVPARGRQNRVCRAAERATYRTGKAGTQRRKRTQSTHNTLLAPNEEACNARVFCWRGMGDEKKQKWDGVSEER